MNGIAFGGTNTFYYPLRNMAKSTSSKLLRERCITSELANYQSDRTAHVYRNALFTMWAGNGQELHMDYDESSTEENPVVRAWGIDSRGKEYEELIYVNKVNPHNATLAEIKALEVHLRKQGERIPEMPVQHGLSGVEYALVGYDVHEKLDFIQFMNEQDEPIVLDQGSIDQLNRLDEERLKLWYLEYCKDGQDFMEEKFD